MIGSEIEFKFLKLCFYKPELWAIGYIPIDPLANWCYEAVKKYSAKYRKYPNFDTFMAYSKSLCESQQYDTIKENFEVKIDTEYTLENIVEFVEKQRLIDGINKARIFLDEGKIKEAKIALFKGSELVYATTLNYFKDKREEKDRKFIPTGFSCLDSPMKGGLHLENLGLIIGPKSSGKSATLINLGANAVEGGHNVLHISFEDSKNQIAERYDHRFRNAERDAVGELHIHVFPSGQAITADCEALVNAYQPSLVIVDYLNEMGWENRKVSKSEDLGERARGLRAIATRHRCGVWTAQQAGKGKKFSDEDVSAEDGFWSYEPSQVTDIVITINQTREEKLQGIIRYNIDRHRNGADGLKFKFNIDYENMKIKEIDSFL